MKTKKRKNRRSEKLKRKTTEGYLFTQKWIKRNKKKIK